MRVLFLGGVNGNSGPANVNKGIVDNLTASFLTVKNKNKLVHLMELFWKILRCNVIVVSGISKKNCGAVILGNILRKKTAYIMHGCLSYESVLNNLRNCENGIKQENSLLKKVDLILPVSKKYSEWVRNRYPQYSYKISYIYNGIDIKLQPDRKNVKNKGTLIASGADRKMKNNTIIAEIVEELSGKLTLEICGKIYDNPPSDLRYSHYTGVLPRALFWEHLKKSELFVMNSTLESFGLSAIEALLCGCSILISEGVGATDLLELEESDIIHNPEDKEEIKSKIMYLLEHPNNQRILEKLDIDAYSYPKQVERLEELCRELINS